MGSVQAFLQARMGSSRLPGKVLLRIHGRTILERAIRRLQASEVVDEVVVLTTTLDEDDAVAEEAGRLGVWVHRGPEVDVLSRFQQASQRFLPEIIVRATADNPLIDIASVGRIVRALRTRRLDYCMESGLPVGSATEAITASALELASRLAIHPRYREHVTLYVKEHADAFRIALLTPPPGLRHPNLRLTVDTPQDFMFVEDLIGKMPESGPALPLELYLDLAERLTQTRA